MNAKDAADRIRPSFKLKTDLAAMSPEDRHHLRFLEGVAVELGVEPTPFNIMQVGEALDAAGIKRDANEYPKMLYSRKPAPDGFPSVYDGRHDHYYAHVADAGEEEMLGAAFVDHPGKLPPKEAA